MGQADPSGEAGLDQVRPIGPDVLSKQSTIRGSELCE